jgi:hypothetical protein
MQRQVSRIMRLGRAEPRMPEGLTPGQRRRWKRNHLICHLRATPLTQAFLADVFDLPRSRIQAILAEPRRWGYPAHPPIAEPDRPAGFQPGPPA